MVSTAVMAYKDEYEVARLYSSEEFVDGMKLKAARAMVLVGGAVRPPPAHVARGQTAVCSVGKCLAFNCQRPT